MLLGLKWGRVSKLAKSVSKYAKSSFGAILLLQESKIMFIFGATNRT
jgi:hypothetical protein